jgi:hypothetical protein
MRIAEPVPRAQPPTAIARVTSRCGVAKSHPRAIEADEAVLVGHSAGGVIASPVMAYALELDADIGRRGSRLVLLT